LAGYSVSFLQRAFSVRTLRNAQVLQDKVQQAAAYFCSRQTLLQPVLFDDRLYHKLLISSYFGLVGFEPTVPLRARLISSQLPLEDALL
jgi:hypothetical protein